MKKVIVPLMLAFGVTLAAFIGQRMSTDAMAVVIGVAVGVAASVPTSLLLVALLRRERTGAWRAEPPAAAGPAAPAAERDRVEPRRFAGRSAANSPTCRNRPLSSAWPRAACAGFASSAMRTTGTRVRGRQAVCCAVRNN